MVALRSCKLSVRTRAAGRNIPEDGIFQYLYSVSQATIKAVHKYHTNLKLVDNNGVKLMLVLRHRGIERDEISSQ
jgi:hypothetical protein